jgi:glycosyltransferase involved in cell wall biosynthesis
MLAGMKIVVVLPAYNAVETLKQTYDEIPHDVVDEIILTDDASNDATVEMAQSLGIPTVRHNRNRGYGGNLDLPRFRGEMRVWDQALWL